MIRLQKEYDKRKSRIRLKQIEAKSSLKKKNFAFFVSERNAKMKQNGRKKKCSRKMRNLHETIF